MRDFRALHVWERAHRLALDVTRTLATVPRRRLTHVVSQGQRAALSVSANIVEGCGHDTAPEFARYLRIALASANELEYHLLVARDLRLLADARHAELQGEVTAVKKMLVVLIQRVRGKG